MNAYEILEEEACKDGIDIVQCEFKSNRIKGLYCDGTIGLSKNIKTTVEKECVLAEELGHHHTTVGNIKNLSNAQNRKQERQARIWAYNNRIGLYGLIRAYEQGCRSRYEVAEFLGVTEEFLEDAINSYRDKYGVCTTVDNYTIYFIPNLIIGKKFE
jgi:hypothetical protein